MDKPEEATLMKFVCSECGQEDEVQMEMNPANFSKAGSSTASAARRRRKIKKV